jgi:predicted membrane protein
MPAGRVARIVALVGGHRHGDRHAGRHAARAEAIRARSERVAERIEERHRRRADAIAAARGRRSDRASRWSAEETARRASAQVARAANNRVVGSVLIAIGANWLLMELGLFPFGFAGLLALGLAVLGLGLMGTAKAGPPGKLLFTGIVMTAILAMSGGVAAQVQGPFAGDPFHQPRQLSQVEDRYSLGFGELTLDLSQVEFARDVKEVEASMVAGELRVIVPQDVALEIDAEVGGGGEISLPGLPSQSGAGGVTRSLADPKFAGAEERLSLRLDLTFGEIVVERAR